ncbi:alkenal/one oxidoreductase, chloroplastic [Seminavis robusta]|uniref:Alkenal/one oxidoreductase, chloroplastic n=1 Tax=Seminavis robusta TaxID=568900 RepID=A0A9N8E7V6_9STRA|nr:alkenal/one oxidoreductase, chloroplastic [Seminavis robusta]|eukprot:Sro643_g180330.1 alkenal/one oxidoreductase, chloroplastic (357) ;mRNA; r:33011-34203
MKLAFATFLLTAAKANAFAVSPPGGAGASSTSTSLPATMKAFVLHEAGPASNLKLEDVPVPTDIGDDEVLIATKAISINPVDYKCRQMDPVLTMVLKTEERPVILGWDVAGIVEKVGSKVDSHKKGDKVFGMVQFVGHGKGYAEYVVAPASHVVTMASNQSFQEAAATTLAALTPLQAMESRVKAGDTVLIHAGSGGTGHFAIQVAKALGAGKVITTSSAKNKDFCMKMGADEHIDYRAVKFEEVAKDVDFVLDGMGGETLERSLKVLKEGSGKVVSLPTPDFPESVTNYAKEHGLTVEFIMVQSGSKDMTTLRDMTEKGQLKAHVSQTLPFEEMPKAHEQLETGRTVGKIVLVKE